MCVVCEYRQSLIANSSYSASLATCILDIIDSSVYETAEADLYRGAELEGSSITSLHSVYITSPCQIYSTRKSHSLQIPWTIY